MLQFSLVGLLLFYFLASIVPSGLDKDLLVIINMSLSMFLSFLSFNFPVFLLYFFFVAMVLLMLLMAETSHLAAFASKIGDRIASSLNNIQLTLTPVEESRAVYVVSDILHYKEVQSAIHQYYMELPWFLSDG